MQVQIKQNLLYMKMRDILEKNTNRPRFQKMMSAIKKKKYNYLVCYKLDRLERNIGDLIKTLNKLNISFISIKKHFDTATPIGKTMLYLTGIPAQMERKQIAEHVMDNMIILAKKKCVWAKVRH